MKALEILNKLKNKMLNFSSKDVEEAIVEIEAMKPKTCDGCNQSFEPNNQTFHKYFCEYLKIPIHGDFYCNRYKPKEQWDDKSRFW